MTENIFTLIQILIICPSLGHVWVTNYIYIV
jgi:hypothetical protein